MIRTFYRLPVASPEDDFHLAIAGIPFDGGLSYRPGARFGPAAIRDISSLARSFHPQHQLNVFKKIKCADIGDFSIDPLDLLKTTEKIENQALNILQKGKLLFSFGGDHSVTLPLLRAHRRYWGTPLGLIHFDAHFDTYPAAWGHDFHHGSFLRHALEEGLVDTQKIIQICIRGSLAGADDQELAQKYAIQTISCQTVKIEGLEQTVKSLKPISGPCYLTFD
ncbi:MAG: arginase family protein, partial [Bdellovibrionaceae bacterium]|nr:arginase family protein [Pseudobdellovibrionaceae bacterium]MDW8191033.1 arginase family protein [Pseudobdellovibrionaceae bacterium]